MPINLQVIKPILVLVHETSLRWSWVSEWVDEGGAFWTSSTVGRLGGLRTRGSMKSSDIKARVRRWLCKYVMWIKKPQRMGKVKHSYHEETIARHTRMMMISKKWATYQQAWMNGWLPSKIVGTLHTLTLTNCDWVGEGDRESNGKSHGKFTFIVGLLFQHCFTGNINIL